MQIELDNDQICDVVISELLSLYEYLLEEEDGAKAFAVAKVLEHYMFKEDLLEHNVKAESMQLVENWDNEKFIGWNLYTRKGEYLGQLEDHVPEKVAKYIARME